MLGRRPEGPAGGCTRRQIRVGKPGFQNRVRVFFQTPERRLSRGEVRFFARPDAQAMHRGSELISIIASATQMLRVSPGFHRKRRPNISAFLDRTISY